MDNQFRKVIPLFFTYEKLPRKIHEDLIDVYVWEGPNPTDWISDVDGMYRL
jgi:hypothetical protein